MKIVSWNINSLRLRLPLLVKFIEKNCPDIICLQEIKVSDPEFPLLEVKSLGYDFVEFAGEKSYNGVAIISKIPLLEVSKIDVLEYGQKRHISAVIETKVGKIDLHNFYVPAGGDIADVILNNKFDHKLKFVDWMTNFFLQKSNHSFEKNDSEQLDKRLQSNFSREALFEDVRKKNLSEYKAVILGDFNIAPLPNDVWSHKQLLDVVSHTPIEVEKLNKLQSSLNFVDTHRFFVDESEKLYSWWSYRALDPLKSDRGRRLDHVWISPNLKDFLASAKIYRDFRVEVQPSDHVPIEIEMNFGC